MRWDVISSDGSSRVKVKSPQNPPYLERGLEANLLRPEKAIHRGNTRKSENQKREREKVERNGTL